MNTRFPKPKEPPPKERLSIELEYYANKSIYIEAWKQAQQQVREMLSDNPEVLDAFDEWVNSTIATTPTQCTLTATC